MKKNSLKYIALCGVLGFTLASCNDWLDVNVDPDQPSNESILVENRLPWIQKYYTYSAGISNMRTFLTCGGIYSSSANPNSLGVSWQPASAQATASYQTWFVGTAGNIVDLYKKAEAEGATYYMGAAEVVYALGFMEMLDLYGEMPFEDAFVGNPAPAYSDGKTIWEGCLARIDHAIELFNTPQAAGATSFASGDIWNGGDVSKWIKLCYGLKARWLLRVTKNAAYYDPAEILACLQQAPQSNADNTFQACYDEKGDKTDFLMGDPIMTNANWDYTSYGVYQWVSKYHKDLLTNMRGAGVMDPRAEKIIPSTMTNIQLDANGNVSSYEWVLTEGVDIYGEAERLVAGGRTSIANKTLALNDVVQSYDFSDIGTAAMNTFIDGVKSKGYVQTTAKAEDLTGGQFSVIDGVVNVCYAPGSWYINGGTYVQAGDTIYGNLKSGSQNTANGNWGMPANDTYYHSEVQAAAMAGAVSATGSFQLFCVSDFDVLTYAEMCFIKAEVLMRQGDASGALTAYQAGIQASFDRMQSQLNQWAGAYENPSMQPMDQTAISAYMSSAAVCQNAGQLTMSDIMLQKYVAMGQSLETWVDMRRFNYSAGNVGGFGVVYPGYGRTKLFTGSAALPGTTPDNPQYWMRRWTLPTTLELSYNTQSALAMNANALEPFVWSLPVWWDCTSDAEYYSYLQ